eukprot:6191016-Pleurochrysis_carterae.AAC.5
MAQLSSDQSAESEPRSAAPRAISCMSWSGCSLAPTWSQRSGNERVAQDDESRAINRVASAATTNSQCKETSFCYICFTISRRAHTSTTRNSCKLNRSLQHCLAPHTHACRTCHSKRKILRANPPSPPQLLQEQVDVVGSIF